MEVQCTHTNERLGVILRMASMRPSTSCAFMLRLSASRASHRGPEMTASRASRVTSIGDDIRAMTRRAMRRIDATHRRSIGEEDGWSTWDEARDGCDVHTGDHPTGRARMSRFEQAFVVFAPTRKRAPCTHANGCIGGESKPWSGEFAQDDTHRMRDIALLLSPQAVKHVRIRVGAFRIQGRRY